MPEAGKKYADFIVALNSDLIKLTEDSEDKLTNEMVGDMIKEILTDVGATLNAKSKEGVRFDHRVFGLVLDVTSNYLFMDNIRVCDSYKNDEETLHVTLLNRLDMTWAFFRQVVDSFASARGLVYNAQRKQQKQSKKK